MSSLRKGLFFRKTDVCLLINHIGVVCADGTCHSVVVRDLCRHTGHITHIKESFSFKTRMPGTVKCRPTVAY